MLLTYEAIDAKGKSAKDSVEAADERDAVDQLRRRGLYVTKLARKNTSEHVAKPVSVERNNRSSGHLGLKTLALFTRQMTMLLKAGSGVVPALSAIKRQMKKPQQAAVLTGLINDLEDGGTLTDSLRKYPGSFDPVYCAIISAGEASATLPTMFERMAMLVGKRRAMRNKIIGAMVYPALLIGMSFNIVILLMFFVLPRFRGMFVQLGVEPPTSTRYLLAMGAFLSDHWIPLAIATLLAVGVLIWSLVSAPGRRWLSDIQTSIPVIGRLRSKLIQVQVFRTFGILLESRVALLDTLSLVRKSTTNRRFQSLFQGLENAVTAGGQLCQAFESSNLIDASVCQAIRTGEDSGRIGEAMTYCADVLEETTTELLNTVMKLLEPAILIVMGLVVGGVAISLFLPLFDLTSAMK